MRRPRAFLVGALTMALAACADRDAPPRAAESADLPAAGPAPAPQPMPGQLPLRSVGGSRVTGEAIVAPEAGGTRVQLTVRGAEPGVRLQANLVTGTCDEPGGGVADLDLFFVDHTGTGTSVVVSSIDPPTLRATPHSLIVQHPQRQPEPIVACVEIAQTPAG